MVSTKSCWVDVNTTSRWVISSPKGWQVMQEGWGRGCEVDLQHPRETRGDALVLCMKRSSCMQHGEGERLDHRVRGEICGVELGFGKIKRRCRDVFLERG